MSPTLCESGVKYFIRASLKESHRLRENHFNIMYNMILATLFILVIFIFLWYRYKGKTTPEERRLRDRETEAYIMGKLQKLSAIKNESITNLPKF